MLKAQANIKPIYQGEILIIFRQSSDSLQVFRTVFCFTKHDMHFSAPSQLIHLIEINLSDFQIPLDPLTPIDIEQVLAKYWTGIEEIQNIQISNNIDQKLDRHWIVVNEQALISFSWLSMDFGVGLYSIACGYKSSTMQYALSQCTLSECIILLFSNIQSFSMTLI